MNWINNFIQTSFSKTSPQAFGGMFFIISFILFIVIKNSHHEKLTLNETSITVHLEKSLEENLPLIYHANGLTKADKSVLIKSEIGGHIETIYVDSGSFIEKSTPILKISDVDLKAQIQAAKAKVKERELEYTAFEKLNQKGVKTIIETERSKAELEAARASLAKLEESVIKAPFDGFMDHIAVDEGELLSSQSIVGRFLALNPLKIICYISEKNRPFIEKGFQASVYFPILQKTVEGKVTFISQTSELRTKVYFLEIEIENKDLSILEGMHCDVEIKTPTKKRHSVPLSSLTLNDEGLPGIKIIKNDKSVYFLPITIQQIQKDNIIFEYPESPIHYIRYGADFLNSNEKIDIQTGKIIP